MQAPPLCQVKDTVRGLGIYSVTYFGSLFM